MIFLDFFVIIEHIIEPPQQDERAPMMKVKKATKCAILAGMAVFGQIARANSPSPKKVINTPQKIATATNSVKSPVYQREEGGVFGAPLLMTPQEGMQLACAFTIMSDLKMMHGDKTISVHVEKITKMPQSAKQVFLKNLTAVKEMKSAWEHINKYMKDKGIEDFSNPSGQLKRAFREDENGGLTTWYVDPKTKKVQEFNFDKDGQEVSAEKIGAPKRFYRYHTDDCNFLMAKTPKDEYIAVEIEQMTHPCPTFTYSDAKGTQYVSLGGAAFIDDGKTFSAYRGTTQELQREVKLQEKAKEVTR